MDIFDSTTIGLIALSMVIGGLLGAALTSDVRPRALQDAYLAGHRDGRLEAEKAPSRAAPTLDSLWREAEILSDSVLLSASTRFGDRHHLVSIEVSSGDCRLTYEANGKSALEALARALHQAGTQQHAQPSGETFPASQIGDAA